MSPAGSPTRSRAGSCGSTSIPSTTRSSCCPRWPPRWASGRGRAPTSSIDSTKRSPRGEHSRCSTRSTASHRRSRSCRRLLERCPTLTILATGRTPLGIRNERTVMLDPLALPAAGRDTRGHRAQPRGHAVRRPAAPRAARSRGHRPDARRHRVDLPRARWPAARDRARRRVVPRDRSAPAAGPLCPSRSPSRRRPTDAGVRRDSGACGRRWTGASELLPEDVARMRRRLAVIAAPFHLDTATAILEGGERRGLAPDRHRRRGRPRGPRGGVSPAPRRRQRRTAVPLLDAADGPRRRTRTARGQRRGARDALGARVSLPVGRRGRRGGLPDRPRDRGARPAGAVPQRHARGARVGDRREGTGRSRSGSPAPCPTSGGRAAITPRVGCGSRPRSPSGAAGADRHRRKALGGAGLLASYQGDYTFGDWSCWRRRSSGRATDGDQEATPTILNWLGTNGYGAGQPRRRPGVHRRGPGDPATHRRQRGASRRSLNAMGGMSTSAATSTRPARRSRRASRSRWSRGTRTASPSRSRTSAWWSGTPGGTDVAAARSRRRSRSGGGPATGSAPRSASTTPRSSTSTRLVRRGRRHAPALLRDGARPGRPARGGLRAGGPGPGRGGAGQPRRGASALAQSLPLTSPPACGSSSRCCSRAPGISRPRSRRTAPAVAAVGRRDRASGRAGVRADARRRAAARRGRARVRARTTWAAFAAAWAEGVATSKARVRRGGHGGRARDRGDGPMGSEQPTTPRRRLAIAAPPRDERPDSTRSIEGLQDEFRSHGYIAERSLATTTFLALELAGRCCSRVRPASARPSSPRCSRPRSARGSSGSSATRAWTSTPRSTSGTTRARCWRSG